MVDNSSDFHPSGDSFLSVLSVVDGPVGEFVRLYPGKAQSEVSLDWIDQWFRERTQVFFEDISKNPSDGIEAESSLQNLLDRQDKIVKRPIRLATIQPHYFRGFCDFANPISLAGNPVVIEGINSSGKTSLAEAVEWLVAGELLRRDMEGCGAPRELENCICNQLRPDGEDTWVEVQCVRDNGNCFTLKRVLVSDYGPTKTSKPKSKLFLDGKELISQEEEKFLDEFFAKIPPLLMQHSLGLFVHSTPSERRDYFEQLLGLDELTYLIEKAVVGNARLSDFPSSADNTAWRKWEQIKASSRERSSRSALRHAENDHSNTLQEGIVGALTTIAQAEFSEILPPEVTFGKIRAVVTEEQKKERQQAFPLLGILRPQRVLDDQLRLLFSDMSVSESLVQADSAFAAFDSTQEAAKRVGDAQIAVAQAFSLLSQEGIILEVTDTQICPLCDYQDIPTLTPDRIQDIISWLPIQQAAKKAEEAFTSQINSFQSTVDALALARQNLIPGRPSEEKWQVSLDGISEAVRDAANRLHEVQDESVGALEPFDQACTQLKSILGKSGLGQADVEQAKDASNSLLSTLGAVIELGQKYANSFADLDKAVASLTREDPLYSLRESWLQVAEDLDAITTDVRWEQAKKKAQSELRCIRESLLSARQEFLDQRRIDFNEGMTSVWEKLRSDRYSVFSELFIPEPRGRGFPVEIEVKALLDNGTQKCEVDALRVFSESQVNVLGIAAFITRSKAIGHRTIILDDPVQSMDEEHFKTFASRLIPYLLDEKFHVILLTHNDTFAREVSYACCDLDKYVTMSIRHSRRKGCQIDEGNRRVAERLKNAERKGEEGNLREAWCLIRLSLERLYTITYKKYGPPDFNPFSWQDQTAEYMWLNGAGEILEAKAAGTGPRLKEILDMTAAGAHDKAAKGKTDLINAISDIRSLLNKLRIGTG